MAQAGALNHDLRPALIHAHSPVLNAFPAQKVARAAGLPMVYEIRAFWEDAAVDRGTTTEGSLRYRLTRAMETRAVKRADHVFTICNGLRDDLLARGVADTHVDLAPNAIEPDRLPPITERDDALAGSLGLGDGPVLGFLGSFYHYEGLHLLIDAFPAIRERHPDARLLLVGGGPEDAALRAKATPLGDAALFTGRVGPEEVRRYYSVVDLLVYPRLRMRLTDLVTPLKPLEAMSMMRPFIASDVGGHKELVEDGVTGRLFAADDPKALADTALAMLDPANAAANAALIDPALNFVRTTRSWSAVAERYLPVYERLTGQKVG
jgi:PEP-CTERM/exosortase A-associated glycosyltransferase